MLTTNQIKVRLIDFFENHAQINTVVYADDFDFSAIPNLVYPVVHIQSVNSQITGKEIISSFKFMIADMEDPQNQDSEDEIWNDTQLIADDFLAFFGDDDYPDFLMDTDTTFQRFSELGTDRTAGVVFTAKVRQTREINPCTIPVQANVKPIVFEGFTPQFD
jgi:hypothetical protein